MRKWIFCALPILAASVAKATGGVTTIYDNTGGGLTSTNAGLSDTGITSIYFDDATASIAAPFTLNQFNLGYSNPTGSSDTFDVLIQFYNTVNYAAGSGVPVGTNPIGSLIDIRGLTAGSGSIGQTGLVNVPGGAVSTNGTVGYELEFVTPGTLTIGTAGEDGSIEPIFNSTTPVVGSSNQDFAYDYLDQGTIVGDNKTGDIFTYSGAQANIYAQLTGTAVPEPTSCVLLAVGSISLLSRRTRRSRTNS